MEKILPREKDQQYTFCINGERNCPPEDCGGIGGFYNLLEVLKDKKHPQHRSMKEWMSGKYDPEQFDADKVNEELSDLA